MAYNKTIVDGTEYQITHGKSTEDGTEREISSGLTTSDGSEQNIFFEHGYDEEDFLIDAGVYQIQLPQKASSSDFDCYISFYGCAKYYHDGSDRIPEGWHYIYGYHMTDSYLLLESLDYSFIFEADGGTVALHVTEDIPVTFGEQEYFYEFAQRIN